MSSPFLKLLSFFKIRRGLLYKNADHIFLHSSFAGFIGRVASIGINGNYYYIPHCISFMRKDLSKNKRKVFVFLEKLANLKKCTYLACSNSEREEIQKEIPNASVLLLENAVDVPFWESTRDSERENIIINVGQIRIQKPSYVCRNL
ncbi:hypothetical protein [Aliamphritea spongicola]|nr:hypothetical protein [Aliamphritea spongicola]